MTLTIWGLPAGGGPYAAIAALTNIPATLLAVCFYEVFLADSSRGEYHLLNMILRLRPAIRLPIVGQPN